MLHFPSREEEIVRYLQNHPKTSAPFLTESGIVQAIAACFARQKMFIVGVYGKVMVETGALNESLQLGIRPWPLGLIQERLVDALVDCAAGKVFQRT